MYPADQPAPYPTEPTLEALHDIPPAVVLRVERGEGNVIEVRWDHGTSKAPSIPELRSLAADLYRDMA